MEGRPFVHPDDLPYLKGDFDKQLQSCFDSFESYVTSDSFRPDEIDFHFSILPEPYCGDVRKATIFILQANPGFSFDNYYSVFKSADFEHRMRKTIYQDLDSGFPFMYLDPVFCWTGGFFWWERKLRGVALQLSREGQLSYVDALKLLARKTASIELVPYHSRKFNAESVAKKLKSVQAVRKFVEITLLPAARNQDIILIITRKAKYWIERLEPEDYEAENIVVYGPREAQAASLSPDSRGGKAILRRLRQRK